MGKKYARAGHQPLGMMNKTEAGYALALEHRLSIGEIIDWRFEKIKLCLGEGVWYYPDFMVITRDYQIEFYEIKGGHIRDSGRVKFLAACEQYPFFKFYMVQVKKGVCRVIKEN